LPEPKGGNFGDPAVFSELSGVEDSPAVQCPHTLRLPARFPFHDLLRGEAHEHLAEWHAIEGQRKPGEPNYVRMRRVLYLHVWRNVILGGAYRDRFRRRAECLDEVFAEYLGAGDVESVRKLRQWIDRRLRPRSASSPRSR
jgi:hypothetical protein